MAWRAHLANQAIQYVHIIPATNPILAVWTRPNLVHFYDLESGAHLGDKKLSAAPNQPFASKEWQTYMSGLSVPNVPFYLPFVRTKTTDLLITDDGKTRLYYQNQRELVLDVAGDITLLPLDGVRRLLAVEFDRQLGTTCAIDDAGQLHLFQLDKPLGVLDIGLRPSELRVSLTISRGGNQLFASDGRRVVSVTGAGKTLKLFETHYDVGRIACSPSGSLLAISDMEAGILRAYRGDDLSLTHQKFAIELIANADQVQLLADLPPLNTTIHALAAFTQGMMAFSMSGVVCMTDVTYMDEVPRR